MYKYLVKRAKDLFKEIHDEELALQCDTLVPIMSNRPINRIIIHAADTDVPKHNRFLKYHLYKWHVEENGWSDYGYHYAINWEGKVIKLRPLSKAGAHCKGHNHDSIGVVLMGKTKFTPEQFDSLRRLIRIIKQKYRLTSNDVYPHNHFNSSKTCPNFDLDEVLNAERNVNI